MNYNQETVNVQFTNAAFLNKVNQGMVKEAGVAMGAFVRQKLREDGFTRKILPAQPITGAELDRGLTEEPQVICEKEPDTVATTLNFLSRSEIKYWTAPRYAVTFQKVASRDFRKSKYELATYRTDIKTILQENSVKDIQAQEDEGFYAAVVASAALNSNANTHTISGGFNKTNYIAGVKKLVANKLPVGCVLMTQEMYLDMMAFPATDVGSQAASELFMGQGQLDNPFGWKVVTTNKADILPNNKMIVFAPPQYLGQFYELEGATVFLKAEQDIIEFTTYESVGIGIGNSNAAVVITF